MAKLPIEKTPAPRSGAEATQRFGPDGETPIPPEASAHHAPDDWDDAPYWLEDIGDPPPGEAEGLLFGELIDTQSEVLRILNRAGIEADGGAIDASDPAGPALETFLREAAERSAGLRNEAAAALAYLQVSAHFLSVAGRHIEGREFHPAGTAIANARQAAGMAVGYIWAAQEHFALGLASATAPATTAAAERKRAATEATRERIRQAALSLPGSISKEAAAGLIAGDPDIGLEAPTVRGYLVKLFPGAAWRTRKSTGKS